MAYTEEQTSVNKLMENEKVGKGNYVTFEGNKDIPIVSLINSFNYLIFWGTHV
jgi:hypothetical protein